MHRELSWPTLHAEAIREARRLASDGPHGTAHLARASRDDD